VYVLLEGAAAYEPFVRNLNELIKRYAVHHRHHHAEESGEPQETEAAA